MSIFLPHADQEVNALVTTLHAESWDQWVGQLIATDVHLFLPRFKLEYQSSLVDVLKALGMGVAFSDEANFSRIRSNGGLRIDDVIHKTFVEVNEEGTEAAAVTAVIIVDSVGAGPMVVRVDRPFVFAIRERHSGTILFIGKVLSL